MMTGRGGLLFLLVGLTLLSVVGSVPTVRLGFLFPLLVNDAAVPSNLAAEWYSTYHSDTMRYSCADILHKLMMAVLVEPS